MTEGPALGRYILERRIASGGMADVYLARQTGAYGFAKRVALKVLKKEISRDDEHVKMFIREALVAAEFRHPNLAQVYEVGEIDGKLFIAMELVPGVSVASLLAALEEQGKPLPRNVAVRIAIDVLDGLAHAHEACGPEGKPLGLVHRDVSPQNIMVAVDGSVKVVDFGIARAELAFGRTMAPKIKGKFSYMPPEQWEPDAPIDARADIFALGVVLYEMTTGGTRLFRGESPKDVYKAIVLDPIPPPRSRVPDYPEGLEKIVMRALERGPGARWPSARAMRTALVEFAQGQGWSLSSRAVADALRAGIGRGDIEDRWEPLGDQGSNDTVSDTVVDVPTPLERPARLNVPSAVAPRREVRVGPAIGTLAGLLALALGTIGGFALGRRSSEGGVRVSDPSTLSGASLGASHRPVRVRGTALLFAGEAGRALRERWRTAHPEIALEASVADASEALAALSAGGAEVVVALRRPTGAERAAAHARGVDLASEQAVALLGHAVATLVSPEEGEPGEISLEEARAALTGGAAQRWRIVARPPADELLALANETLTGGAALAPGAEVIEDGAAAIARMRAQGHALTLLRLAEYDEAARAGSPPRRVVLRGSEGAALEYPVWVVTRGPATGDARSFVDWLGAVGQQDLLARASIRLATRPGW